MTIAETLETSRVDFCSAVDGLTDEVAARKPAPDRWSVLDCMEHVITVEHRFLGWLRDAGRLPEPQPDAAKEAKLAGMVADRTTKAMAPEAVHPTGKYTSIAVALAEFNAARALSLAEASRPVVELYELSATHPRFGPVNGTELMTIMAGHSSRHAAQIRETRAALGLAAAG
jgi:hypothetical protein